MKSLRYVTAIVVAVLAIGSSAAFAQQQEVKPLRVSTGGKTGTYFRLVEELKAACPQPTIENVESGGSLANIDAIINNKAELGITQYDVLFLRSQKEAEVQKRVFALFPLHQEEIHLISKSQPHKEGGTSLGVVSFGGKMVVYNTMADLRGRKIGYWGGTKTTVDVITNVALIGWDPVEYANQEAALTGLKADEVDAIIAVGGQPLSWVEKLGQDYKLLEVLDQQANALKNVYDKSTLSYRNLGQDGVATLSVEALLVTRNYSSAPAIKRLTDLRNCAIQNVDTIRDTPDTHPKWQSIDPAKMSRWQMFTPAINPATPTAPTVATKAKG
jgi:uncharacterized protein